MKAKIKENSKKAEVIFNGTKKVFKISEELVVVDNILELLSTISIAEMLNTTDKEKTKVKTAEKDLKAFRTTYKEIRDYLNDKNDLDQTIELMTDKKENLLIDAIEKVFGYEIDRKCFYIIEDYVPDEKQTKNNIVIFTIATDGDIVVSYNFMCGMMWEENFDWEDDGDKMHWRFNKNLMNIEKTAGATLYWVETDDHDDDWFMVAYSSLEAKKRHSEYNDYCFEKFNNEYQLRAIPVCSISEKIYTKHANDFAKSLYEEENKFWELDIKSKHFTFFPSDELFKELGLKYVKNEDDEPKVVLYDKIIFTEGNLDAKVSKAHKMNYHFMQMGKNNHLN